MNTVSETESKPATLDSDSVEVFHLLEEARNEYGKYLVAQESVATPDMWEPSAGDYNWRKPLTVVFAH
jgi:hypothetical protein